MVLGGANVILHTLQLQRYVADMRRMIAEAHSKMDISVSVILSCQLLCTR